MPIRAGYHSELVRNESFGLSIDKAKTLCEKIYAVLLKHGGMTADEISKAIGNPRVYVIHARLNELMKEGLVIDTKETKINPETKKKNTIWKAVPLELTLFSFSEN